MQRKPMTNANSQVKLGDLLANGSNGIIVSNSSTSLDKNKKQIASLKKIRGKMMAIKAPDIQEEKQYLKS